MPTVAISRAALRIVLFGMPDAGKSSLLGALSQAARLQEHVLNGHLSDPTQGLAELRQRLYEGTPRQTVEEVAPFPVAYEPFAPSANGRLQAVLIDCDGRVANDLLTRRRALASDEGRGQLGDAVLHADAVVLAVDAAAGTPQVDADLAEFVRFLRLLEQNRGLRTDVGGLPVFLVLTKCDLLAQAQDSLTLWIERIEERKRKVGQRFETFLAEGRTRHAAPFGSIDLHPWATSIKRPALEDSPAKPQEPYGVAELFRQSFEQARGYRERQQRSGRRLLWTVLATGGSLAVLATLIAFLFMTRPSERVTTLNLDVEHLEARHQQLSAVSRHKDVQTKIDELARIDKDPAFTHLPPERQAYVQNLLKELTAYRQFEQALNQITDPRDARDAAQLEASREKLRALQVPPEYADEWAGTPALERRRDRLEDIEIIERTAKELQKQYENVIFLGKQVLAESDQPNLPKRAKAVLEQARRLPDPKTERDGLLPGTMRLSYQNVFNLSGVANLARQWEEVRKELEPFAQRAEKP